MFQIKFKNSLMVLLGLAAFALFASAPAYSQDKVLDWVAAPKIRNQLALVSADHYSSCRGDIDVSSH